MTRDPYERVDVRIDRFWTDYPDGRIETHLVLQSADRFIVKTLIFRTGDDMDPAATGYAEERVGTSEVNKRNALENCETSSIGRTLATLGYSTKGSHPSQTEPGKSNREGRRIVLEAAGGDRDLARALWSEAASNHGAGPDDLLDLETLDQVIAETLRLLEEQKTLTRDNGYQEGDTTPEE